MVFFEDIFIDFRLSAMIFDTFLTLYRAFIENMRRISIHFSWPFRQQAHRKVFPYDSIKPFYTDSVGGGESFNCIVTDSCPDMKRLYEKITADRARYKDKETLAPVNVADNIFSITALPSLHYTQLNLNDASRPDSLAPAIAIGKYELHEGKLMLPLTLWIHHAVCDGFPVGKFYSDVQRLMPKVIDEIINGENSHE